MEEALFELKDVWKVYTMKGVETNALRGINIRVKKGDYLAILGPSGSGKSTLMHVIGLLDTPTKGQMLIDGKDVSELGEDDLAKIRRKKIGFVFQSYNLINSLTAVENVALPMRFAGVSKGDAEKKAMNLLVKVGLADRLTHKPTELSGGQQQRVAIARALANDPDVILADEPTGNLDTKSGKEIFELLEELHTKMNKTVVLVTHDISLSQRAHREIRIVDGAIFRDKGNLTGHSKH